MCRIRPNQNLFPDHHLLCPYGGGVGFWCILLKNAFFLFLHFWFIFSVLRWCRLLEIYYAKIVTINLCYAILDIVLIWDCTNDRERKRKWEKEVKSELASLVTAIFSYQCFLALLFLLHFFYILFYLIDFLFLSFMHSFISSILSVNQSASQSSMLHASEGKLKNVSSHIARGSLSTTESDDGAGSPGTFTE